jgi:hypothetical protein
VLKATMPYSEFIEWIAYSRIEPFGEERADWRSALVASVYAEVNRGRTKRKKPYTPKDFLLNFEGPKRQSWQSQLQFVELLNAAFGGKDERRRTAEGEEGEGLPQRRRDAEGRENVGR